MGQSTQRWSKLCWTQLQMWIIFPVYYSDAESLFGSPVVSPTSPMLTFLTAGSFQPGWSLLLGGLAFTNFNVYFPSQFYWLSLFWNSANPHQLWEQAVCVLGWTCEVSKVSSCLFICHCLFWWHLFSVFLSSRSLQMDFSVQHFSQLSSDLGASPGVSRLPVRKAAGLGLTAVSRRTRDPNPAVLTSLSSPQTEPSGAKTLEQKPLKLLKLKTLKAKNCWNS